MAADTSTQLCASLNGWSYPFSQEAALTADLFDVVLSLVAALANKPSLFKPHPGRPWVKRSREHYGSTGGRGREEIVKLLELARTGQFTDR